MDYTPREQRPSGLTQNPLARRSSTRGGYGVNDSNFTFPVGGGGGANRSEINPIINLAAGNGDNGAWYDDDVDDEDRVYYDGPDAEGLTGAVITQNQPRLAFLLSNNINKAVDTIDQRFPNLRNRTALHCAVMTKDEEAVRLLVEAGASVGEPEDDDDETPLTMAVMYFPKILPFLLEQRRKISNLRRVDQRGRNLLHRIVSKHGGGINNPKCHVLNDKVVTKFQGQWDRLSILKRLVIEEGLSIKQKDEKGFTPAEWARENFLSLGSDATAIVDFLESAAASGGALATGSGIGKRAGFSFLLSPPVFYLSKFLSHPLTRIILILLLLIGHFFQYAIEPIDREFAVAHSVWSSEYAQRLVGLDPAALTNVNSSEEDNNRSSSITNDTTVTRTDEEVPSLPPAPTGPWSALYQSRVALRLRSLLEVEGVFNNNSNNNSDLLTASVRGFRAATAAKDNVSPKFAVAAAVEAKYMEVQEVTSNNTSNHTVTNTSSPTFTASISSTKTAALTTSEMAKGTLSSHSFTGTLSETLSRSRSDSVATVTKTNKPTLSNTTATSHTMTILKSQSKSGTLPASSTQSLGPTVSGTAGAESSTSTLSVAKSLSRGSHTRSKSEFASESQTLSHTVSTTDPTLSLTETIPLLPEIPSRAADVTFPFIFETYSDIVWSPQVAEFLSKMDATNENAAPRLGLAAIDGVMGSWGNLQSAAVPLTIERSDSTSNTSTSIYLPPSAESRSSPDEEGAQRGQLSSFVGQAYHTFSMPYTTYTTSGVGQTIPTPPLLLVEHPLEGLPNVLMTGFCASGLSSPNPRTDRQLAIFHVIFSVIDLIGFGWFSVPPTANGAGLNERNASVVFNTTLSGGEDGGASKFPHGNRKIAIISRVLCAVIGVAVGVGFAFFAHEFVFRRLLRMRMFGANTSIYVSRGRRYLIFFSALSCAYFGGLVHNALMIDYIAPNAKLALQMSTEREQIARNWTLTLADEAANLIFPSVLARRYLNIQQAEADMVRQAATFYEIGTERLPLGRTPLISADSRYYDDYDVLRDLSMKPCLPQITPIRALKGFVIVALLLDFIMLWSVIDAMFQESSFKLFIPNTIERAAHVLFPKRLRTRFAKRRGRSPTVRIVLFWAAILFSFGAVAGVQFVFGDFLSTPNNVPSTVRRAGGREGDPVAGDNKGGDEYVSGVGEGNPTNSSLVFYGDTHNTDRANIVGLKTKVWFAENVVVTSTGGAPYGVEIVEIGEYKPLINPNGGSGGRHNNWPSFLSPSVNNASKEQLRHTSEIFGEDYVPPIVTGILILLTVVIMCQEWSFPRLSAHSSINMPGFGSTLFGLRIFRSLMVTSTGWWLWSLTTASLILDIRLYVFEVSRYVSVIAERHGNSYAYVPSAGGNAAAIPSSTGTTAADGGVRYRATPSTTLLDGASVWEIGVLVAMVIPVFIAAVLLGVALWVSSLRGCKGPNCWADQALQDHEIVKEEPLGGLSASSGTVVVTELSGSIPYSEQEDEEDDEDEANGTKSVLKISEKKAKEFAKLEESAAGEAFGGAARRVKQKDQNQNPNMRAGRGKNRRGSQAQPATANANDNFSNVSLAHDIWHCAFSDDAVRMCSILEQQPELLDARGGFGLICDQISGKAVYCYEFDTGARGYNVPPFSTIIDALYSRYTGGNEAEMSAIISVAAAGSRTNTPARRKGGREHVSPNRQRNLMAQKGLIAGSVHPGTAGQISPERMRGQQVGAHVASVPTRLYAVTPQALQSARQAAVSSAMSTASVLASKAAAGAAKKGAGGDDNDEMGGGGGAAANANVYADPMSGGAAADAGNGGGGGGSGVQPSTGGSGGGVAGVSEETIAAMIQKAVMPIPTHPFAATPLHYAIAGKARSTMASLINRGANLRLRTAHGMHTCQQLAELCDNKQFAEMVSNR